VALSRALVGSGDALGALGAIDALGPTAPGEALAEKTLALALLHRTREAEATLGRVPESDLPAPRAALLRYMLAWQKLDLHEAEHQATQAAATGDGEALARRAEVLLALGKRNPAVRMLAASASACARAYGQWIDGQWDVAYAALDAARAQEGPCVARVLGRNGLGFSPPTQLVTDLATSLAHWPDAEDRILLGRARFRAGQDGATEIGRVIEGGAESMLALTLAAEAYAEMGKKDDALAVVRKAKTLYPQDPRPLAAEIRVVRMSGDNDGAMRLSEAALTAFPDQPDLVRERSITLVEAGRIAESERVSDIAYTAGPHFVEFARARIRAVEAAKGFPPADQQMVRALRFTAFLPFSEEVRVRSMIALLHARRGGRRELDAAEAFLRPLVRLDVKSADFNLAMAAVDRGYQRVVQLGAHLRRALALEPLMPDAYQWLKEADALEPPLQAQYDRLFPGRPL
jgi:tetratricopeptide (TPR) repeat protein